MISAVVMVKIDFAFKFVDESCSLQKLIVFTFSGEVVCFLLIRIYICMQIRIELQFWLI
jgi:hypothetical protein